MQRAATVLAMALAAMTIGRAGAAFAGDADAAPAPVTDKRATVQSAVATPVQDLNLKKTAIPDVLQAAAANPYDVAGVGDCAAIAAEVASLDQALGADKDAPPDADADDDDKGSTVATVLQTGVQAIIPYRGVVRHLSGANAHEKTMTEAIRVGFARRGFLKGRAVEMNCAAPASPAGYVQKPELASAPIDLPPPVPPAPAVPPAAPLEVLTAAPTAEATPAAVEASGVARQ